MPLIDGIQSTMMIRKLELELNVLKKSLSRVPIVAVSASLTEDNRFDYVQSGYVDPERLVEIFQVDDPHLVSMLGF
jgi:CheY-like chemotaxis protein